MTSHLPRPTRAFGRLTRLYAALSLGTLAAFGAFGCAGDERFSSTPEERGPEAYKATAAGMSKLGYRWDWSGFTVPASGEGVIFLDAFADIVVAQDTSSKLSVIEASSGRVRWFSELANRSTKFVGTVRDKDPVRGDRLVACSEAEAFLLDVQTGNVLGRQHFEKVVNTRSLLIGPIAWFGTPNGEMLGHLLTRGVKFNGYQMPGAIEQPLVRIGTTIAAVSQAGEVAFIDASSGTLIGRTRIYGGTASEPVASDTLMYVASLDQSLYAFNTAGQTVWRKRTSKPVFGQPTLVGPTLYCTIADSGFTAFDAASGKERWSNKDVGGTAIGLRNKRLLVWDGKTLSLVDENNGGTIERVEFPGVLRFSLDKFADGNLYAVNRAGVIGKFVPR